MLDFIPKAALDYIKSKKLTPSFSYKDVWNEEHAACFTVAKAMQIDVLQDLHSAVTKAIEQGQSFETFKKGITPILQQKGWWGKKEMTDPLTGRPVQAQLGSDRRLRTIYHVNMRSAYQKGQYDRAMASDLHPYLMYRIGPSVNHRPDHQSWDRLILPKDDPWWDSHFPPNGWGCKCYTRAVSEERLQKYKREGIAIPPRADGTGGGMLPVKTSAPPVVYKNIYNERKGIIERIPEGISPGFNWNQGKSGRSTAVLQQLIKKTRDKTPEHYDAVMKTIFNNEIFKTDFYGFVEKAVAGKLDEHYMTPVGFIDKKITQFLQTKGIDVSENNIILLGSRLINAGKYYGTRSHHLTNAPLKSDWYNLFEWLIDAPVYWDKKGLIYLAQLSESRYMKIVVDVSLKIKGHRSTALYLPKVDTAYSLDVSTEASAGLQEYNRITAMKKIR